MLQLQGRILNIHKTYLQENCDIGDESLSQQDFLKLFKLKNISNTTIWKWMQRGIFVQQEKKTYRSDKYENEENVLSWKKFEKFDVGINEERYWNYN